MFTFGNRFGAAKTHAKVEVGQDPKETTAEAREGLERATQACEAKSEELVEARSRLTALERQAGMLDADNQDSTAATDAVQAATILVRRLENSLAVLLQRKSEAEGALTHAQLLATEAAKRAACVRVLALGPKAEAILTAIESFIDDEYAATEHLRLVCGNTYGYAPVEIRSQFDLFLGIAKRNPASRGFDSGAYMKYKKFSECLEAVCGRGARQ